MILQILLFLLLGIGVGTFGTLVGIGGGLICVPVFILFLSEGGVYPYFHSAAQITGTSLVVVMANALSGTAAYIRQKRVLFRAAVPFALATLPGAILGSYIVDDFSGPMLDFYFGIFLLLMSLLMGWNATHSHRAEVAEVGPDFQFNQWIGIGASFCVGFLSSIFGIGGGVVHVPLMIYLLVACSSLFGVISHFLLHHIVWLPAICISLGAAIGAQLGARISQKTKSKVILVLLSCAMFALGLRLIALGSTH